jgi:glutaredoxin
MMLRAIAQAAIALAVVATAHAQSDVYRWVDKDGKVHFSDAPPPEDAQQVTQRRMGGGQVDEGQLPYATQVATKRNPVTLYTSPRCGDLCQSGRDVLIERGVPYSERNAETPAEAENVKKLVGALEVPVLQVGDNAIKGFNDSTWQGALDAAGYPRTRIPGAGSPKPPPPVTAPPTPAPAPAAAPQGQATQ